MTPVLSPHRTYRSVYGASNIIRLKRPAGKGKIEEIPCLRVFCLRWLFHGSGSHRKPES